MFGAQLQNVRLTGPALVAAGFESGAEPELQAALIMAIAMARAATPDTLVGRIGLPLLGVDAAAHVT